MIFGQIYVSCYSHTIYQKRRLQNVLKQKSFTTISFQRQNTRLPHGFKEYRQSYYVNVINVPHTMDFQDHYSLMTNALKAIYTDIVDTYMRNVLSVFPKINLVHEFACVKHWPKMFACTLMMRLGHSKAKIILSTLGQRVSVLLLDLYVESGLNHKSLSSMNRICFSSCQCEPHYISKHNSVC